MTSKHANVFPVQVVEAFLEDITDSVHGWHEVHIGVIQEVVLQLRCLSSKVKHGDVPLRSQQTNNLRYADDITLTTESEEELKSFLMKVKEKSEKVGLKPNI